MGFGDVGKVYTVDSFAAYLKALKRTRDWDGVCLHHTAAPSLAQRPKGLLMQHIYNIRDYYKGELGWTSGPHRFTDEDQIYGMCPLNQEGVHARSFNDKYLSIEALGDYDVEMPDRGRGLQVWQTTAKAAALMFQWAGVTPSMKTLKFHREDPKTTKTCPGRLVSKEWVLSLILSPPPAEPVEEWAVTVMGNRIERIVELAGRPSMSAHEAFTLMGRPDQWPVKTDDNGRIVTQKGDELEGAKYIADRGETFAPIRELAEACGKKCLAVGKAITVEDW